MAKTVAIVGAGAAGCFCAIEIKRQNPSYRVVVFEANPKAMQKLAITGGGRCNLTNSFESVNSLNEVYPRGDKLMQRLFYEFNHKDTMKWFENEGVRLVVQDDNCVFPVSQDAMQIVRTLLRLMDRYGVELLCNKRVSSIKGNNYDNEVQNATGLPRYARNDDSLYYKESNYNDERKNNNNKEPNYNNFRHCERNEMECGNPFTIKFSDNSLFSADYVVVTAGGTKQNAIKAMLPEGIELSPTVPSLYTFKIQNPALRALMGAVVPNVQLGLVGTKFRSNGALLITDWGVSGPATLKLSSYAANYLASNTYQADLMINWLGMKEDETRKILNTNSKKLLINLHPNTLTERLWKFILSLSGLDNPQLRYCDLSPKAINRLIQILCASIFHINGRAAFKEEFVTCGGVNLSSIKLKSLESKLYPGLYFAGEILDIDAITGGFNLQAAWTTAFVVAKNLVK